MSQEYNISESCYVYVPVPFRKGDIVRVDNVFSGTYYAVIPEDMTKPIAVNFRRNRYESLARCIRSGTREF